MAPMTTHERVKRMFEHREADRVPVTDSPWAATIDRWHREGLPEDVDFSDYFQLDKFASIGADNSPRFPEEVLEETERYRIHKTRWGTTLRNWKDHGGTPEFLDYTIVDADAWAAAKKRMTPDRDRVDWDRLKADYKRWREEGRWIYAGMWFGFDVSHSWIAGTERILIAMATDPEWVVDMWNHMLDVSIALHERVWDAGYEFDAIRWPDDMGYKLSQFFSLDMYRDMLKPVHARACDWGHAKGVKVELHSCGDVRPFVPDLIEIGVDMLNPIEVKAGMDPIRLKQTYGERLAFHGGLNAALYPKPEQLYAQMEQVIPVLKEDGGYIAGTDHSVPDTVSLEDFRRFTDLAKKLGTYD